MSANLTSLFGFRLIAAGSSELGSQAAAASSASALSAKVGQSEPPTANALRPVPPAVSQPLVTG